MCASAAIAGIRQTTSLLPRGCAWWTDDHGVSRAHGSSSEGRYGAQAATAACRSSRLSVGHGIAAGLRFSALIAADRRTRSISASSPRATDRHTEPDPGSGSRRLPVRQDNSRPTSTRTSRAAASSQPRRETDWSRTPPRWDRAKRPAVPLSLRQSVIPANAGIQSVLSHAVTPLADLAAEIAPIWVHLFNQFQLPASLPFLDRLSRAIASFIVSCTSNHTSV